MSQASTLEQAICIVPPGRWAVGVSGGVDSVALLSLLRARADLSLRVAHLNHQTRGPDSDSDAEFVCDLAEQWNLPVTIARRDEIEPLLVDPPANASALYRELRLTLFRRVVQSHGLSGVILAHHSLDQAETVLQRLLRGSAYPGLTGMSPRTEVGGLAILRPLLGVDRKLLEMHLVGQRQAWRIDASNESDLYLRNRLRKLLKRFGSLQHALQDLADACGRLRDWARGVAPVLPAQFECSSLLRNSAIIAHESARQWLIDRGVPIEDVSSEVVERLVEMARDAASAPRRDFPGPLRVRRRQRRIFIDQG